MLTCALPPKFLLSSVPLLLKRGHLSFRMRFVSATSTKSTESNEWSDLVSLDLEPHLPAFGSLPSDSESRVLPNRVHGNPCVLSRKAVKSMAAADESSEECNSSRRHTSSTTPAKLCNERPTQLLRFAQGNHPTRAVQSPELKLILHIAEVL